MKNKNSLKIGSFLLVFLTLFLININFISAHHTGISGKAFSGEVSEGISENIPGDKIISNIEIDPETGQPKQIIDIKEKIDEYREQNVSYLRKEWTKMLADNKFFGPFLFYTDKVFSIFNPLWKYSFGMEFAWSLAFFFHIFLWLVIICIIFFPAKEIFKNSLFALITGVIVASITGSFGIITKFVNILDVMFNKLWMLTIFVIIVVLLIVIYAKLFKGFREESEEEELKRSKEAIKAHGEVSGKALEEMSK